VVLSTTRREWLLGLLPNGVDPTAGVADDNSNDENASVVIDAMFTTLYPVMVMVYVGSGSGVQAVNVSIERISVDSIAVNTPAYLCIGGIT